MDTCWNQDPWPYEYPPGYERGLVRPDRKWFTNHYMGGARERMALTKGENVSMYWHVLNFSLAARDTQASQFVPTPDAAIVAMTATETQESPGFRTRVQQIVDETHQLSMERVPVNDRNAFGTGGRPFYPMLPPWYPPDFGSVMVRCGNLANATNTVQLCFIELRPRMKTQ